MPEVLMFAHSVGTGGDRTVVQLRAVDDPNDENAATGNMQLVIRDPDAQADFEEGQVYSVSFNKAEAPEGSSIHAHAAAAKAAAMAAAIPNASNTPNFRPTAAQRTPPPQVPDGVVTEPRPAVVLEPLADTPPTAGVTSGPPDNPTPADSGGTTTASGGTASTTSTTSTRSRSS